MTLTRAPGRLIPVAMTLKKPRVLGRTGLSVSRLGMAAGYGVPAAAVEKALRGVGLDRADILHAKSPRWMG
jgi:hypothetical protein